MLATDRDALVCDLAETYGIFDHRALPATLLATLAVGLRDDSRIKIRLSGGKVPRSEMLLAAAVDRLSLLVWGMTEDAQLGRNRPASLLDALLGEEEKSGDIVAFDTAEDFETEWTRITGVEHGEK